jgi:3'5'-cyclic nucleotide phosphodiesterase
MENWYIKLRNTLCCDSTELARFCQLVINSVMATDLGDKELKALRNSRWDKAFQEQAGKECALGSSSNTQDENPMDEINRKATIVIEHLIQASNVSHTMQHWHIFHKWNEKLFVKMYDAYHAGRAKKNPADFWYNGELGFFDFYVIPLAKILKDCGVFGLSSDESLNFATTNVLNGRNEVVRW